MMQRASSLRSFSEAYAKYRRELEDGDLASELKTPHQARPYDSTRANFPVGFTMPTCTIHSKKHAEALPHNKEDKNKDIHLQYLETCKFIQQ
jgi:hypothetical protein